MSTETLMMLSSSIIMLIGAVSAYLHRSHTQRQRELEDTRIEADYWRSQLRFAETRKARVNLVKACPVEPPKPAEPDPASFIPADDPMVLCPSCGLMGMHSLELITPADRTDVEFYVWNSAIPLKSPPYYVRQCLFCQHTWRAAVTKEPLLARDTQEKP